MICAELQAHVSFWKGWLGRWYNIEGRHGALWILLTIFIKESSHVQLIHIQL